MNNKVITATKAFRIVIKLFLEKTPSKVIIESMLSSANNILIVINAVWLMEHLTDVILTGGAFFDALKVLFFVTVLQALVSILQSFYDYCIKPKSDLKVKQDLEMSLMEHAEKLSLGYYENSDFYTTVQQAQNAVSDTVFSAYQDSVQVIGNVAALIIAVTTAFALDPLLLIFIIFSAPMILLSRKYGRLFSDKKMSLVFWERKKQYAKATWMSKELARMFQITNAWRIADKHYEEGYQGSVKTHNSYSAPLFGWKLLETEFSITIIMLACYMYGIFASVYVNGFSASSFSVMFVAVMNMISKIRKIYKLYENFCGYGVQLKALQDFVELAPEDRVQEGLLPGKFESLEFCHVWFSYDGINWALKDVSFRIQAGEKIAILGYNGAGKTTLIKLLLRFYSVNRGKILYNGVDIEQYQLDEYRRKFSAAFQDYKLFSISLAENILMKECTLDEEQAVKDTLMQMDRIEFAENTKRILGREYDAEGMVFSGGQQQWLAVARLHFDTFDVAVLDEPSAAFDPIAAGQMMENVLNFVKNRSMFIVSHDMSVAKVADRIIFLEEGELIACAAHEELMQQNSKYAEFYKCQAESYRRK